MALGRERGASTVEFAVVLPLLLLLVFGIIEFGVFLYDKAVITNASREGARYGILYRPDRSNLGSEINTVVQNYTQNNLITFGAAAVATADFPNGSPAAMVRGDLLMVRVQYPYGFLFVPAFISDLAGSVTLEAATTMRVE